MEFVDFDSFSNCLEFCLFSSVSGLGFGLVFKFLIWAYFKLFSLFRSLSS